MRPASSPAFSPASSPPASSPPASPIGVLAADGDGWTSAGLDGPVPAAGSCHYRTSPGGYYLPDPVCTPGAIDPGVTQADLATTICRPGGHSASVRPPEAITEPFKYRIESAYRDPAATSATELDHLVPLGLGGASDTRNLWPEPDQGQPALFDPRDPYGRNAKDGVEDRLHYAVCGGHVTLLAAQQAIAADWPTALSRSGVTP